jgi:hypothetical protein
MSKGTPAAPDYTQAAQQQAQSSQAATEAATVANRPTINTPFGQQSWELTPVIDPVTGQAVSSWTQNTTLTPQTQAALDSQMNIQQGKSQTAEDLLGQFREQESQPIDWNSFASFAGAPHPTTTGGAGTGAQYDKNAADAAFNSFMGYNQPLMDQAKSQLDTQLKNQGLNVGDEAYDTAMKNLENQQSQSVQQAGYGSILTGSQIGNQNAATDLAHENQGFNQNLTSANYQDTLREAQAAEAMQRQGFSLNQINAILNGQQVGLPQTPGFATAGTSQPVQALSAAQGQGQSMLDQYNANQQNTQGIISGVGTAAGIAAMFF